MQNRLRLPYRRLTPTRRWSALLLALAVVSHAGAVLAQMQEPAVTSPSAPAQQQVYIDWTSRKLVVWGHSETPKGARLLSEVLPMAELQAKADVRHQLYAYLCSAPLLPPGLIATDAKPSLASWLQARPDRQQLLATAILQNNAEETIYRDNGSVTIRAALPLDGGQGSLGALWRLLWATARIGQPVAEQQARLQANRDAAAAPELRPGGRAPTGVVVQAKGLRLQPSLWPRILDQRGNVLYAADSLDQELLQAYGVATFVRSIEAGLQDPRVAQRAILVKAIALPTADASDVVIDDSDAETLAGLAAVLREGRVMFVVD